MQRIDIAQKTRTPIFYAKQEQIKKLYPTETKRQQPLQTFWAETVTKIFGLAGLGGRINLETFQKFDGKEEKNQDQTHQLVSPLKILRFHDFSKDFTKRFPNSPIFTRKLVSIFYKNKILTEN